MNNDYNKACKVYDTKTKDTKDTKNICAKFPEDKIKIFFTQTNDGYCSNMFITDYNGKNINTSHLSGEESKKIVNLIFSATKDFTTFKDEEVKKR